MKKSIIVLITFFLLGSSVYAQEDPKKLGCPCYIEMDAQGNINMFNQFKGRVKYYSAASSKNNIALEVRDKEFYVLRSNYQVFVYDKDTGNMLRVYFVNKKQKAWVK
jgi:hypothetical protein